MCVCVLIHSTMIKMIIIYYERVSERKKSSDLYWSFIWFCFQRYRDVKHYLVFSNIKMLFIFPFSV